MIICPWKDIARYETVIPGLKEAVEAAENKLREEYLK